MHIWWKTSKKRTQAKQKKTVTLTMRKTLEVSVDGDPVAKLRLSSRGFCEWFMLVQMFIFMVIISHGTLQTAKELQKFNDMLTLNVTVEKEPPSNTTWMESSMILVSLGWGCICLKTISSSIGLERIL